MQSSHEVNLTPFNQIVNDLDQVLVNGKRCDFVSMAPPLNANNLSDLPIKSSRAYVRCGEQLYFVNRVENLCQLINLSESQLKEFDSTFPATFQAIPLHQNQLKQVSAITGHSFKSGIEQILYCLQNDYEDSLKMDCGRTVAFPWTSRLCSHLLEHKKLLQQSLEMFLGMMLNSSIDSLELKKKSQVLSQISMFAHRILILISLIKKVECKARSNIEIHLRKSGYDMDVTSDLTKSLKILEPIELLARKTAQVSDHLLQSINIVDFKHLYFMKDENAMEMNIKRRGVKQHAVILVEDNDSSDYLDVKAYFFVDKEKKMACSGNGDPVCVSLKLTQTQRDFIDNHMGNGGKPRKSTQYSGYDPEHPLRKKIFDRKKPITKDGPLVSKHGRFKTDDIKQVSCHIKHGMFCSYTVTTSRNVNDAPDMNYVVTKADIHTKNSILKSANEAFLSRCEKKAVASPNK